MWGEHGCVDAYIESIKDYKEVLTDPNQFLTSAEMRLGKGRPVKVWLFIKANIKKLSVTGPFW